MQFKTVISLATVTGFKRLTLIALPLLAAACANTSPMPVPALKESLHTEVAADGAKRFTYSLEMLRADIPLPFTDREMNRGMNRGGHGNREAMMRSARRGGRGPGVELYFDRAMLQKLAETGFCRDGYFEIERSVSPSGGEVRGECREGAEPAAQQQTGL